MDSENIYKRIDKLRELRGLSVYEMANKAGVSSSAIYRWRDRKTSPSLYLLDGLCDVLGVNIINLLIDSDKMVYLSNADKTMFERWNALKQGQKQTILTLMESLQKENK